MLWRKFLFRVAIQNNKYILEKERENEEGKEREERERAFRSQLDEDEFIAGLNREAVVRFFSVNGAMTHEPPSRLESREVDSDLTSPECYRPLLKI